MSVVQGCFPNGLPRFSNAAAPLQAKTTAGWVEAAIAQVGWRPPIAQAKTAAPRVLPPAAPQRAVLAPRGFSPLVGHGGQPLPMNVRQRMEAAFRTTFADVRVHVGPLATSIGALAFTHGSHIHFAPGQYNPDTPRGQQLLGHELAHVVQQRTGRVRNPFGSGVAIVHDPALEAEAARVVQRSSMIVVHTTPVLSAAASTPNDPYDNGPVGSFEYRRTWTVANPQDGVIIQKVERTFHVKLVNANNEMSGNEIDQYAATNTRKPYGTVTQYWELWTVDSSGNVSDSGEDTFGLCSIIKAGSNKQKNTTKGSFQIKGTAYFYATNITPKNLGFKKDAVETAGGLYSRSTIPNNLPNATSGPVTCTVDVTWDSSQNDIYSQVNIT